MTETNLGNTDTIDLDIFRGEDKTFRFYVDPPNPDGGILGWAPGFSVSRYVRDKTGAIRRSGDPLIDVNCTILDSDLGTFTADVNHSDFFDVDGNATALVPGEYIWDTWRMVSGSRRVLQSGLFVVKPNARFG